MSCTLDRWKNTPFLPQAVLSEHSQEVKMGLAAVTVHACSVHEQSLFLVIALVGILALLSMEFHEGLDRSL